MPDVFLSHSSQNKDFVRELYARLTRDGVDCFFDEVSIGWGDNWVRALERAVDECKFIVFVLSPDFCESKWVEVERTSSLATDPAGLKQKIRPLLLEDCRDLPSFPRFLRQIQLIDVSSTDRFEANYSRICTELGGIVQVQIVLQRGSLPPVAPLPNPHRMPYHSLGDGFVGRVDELWQIHDKVNNGQTMIVQGVGVVMGMGGLGKSQLATEYVHRFGRAYPGGVFWIDADQGLGRVIEQISTAADLQLDGRQSETLQLERVWKQLSSRMPTLIVLDNFPEDEFLRSYLPSTGRIHTLVTTRRRDLTNYSFLTLNSFNESEGLRLLNGGERRFGSDATALVRRLGGLPLALELVRSFLNFRKDLSVTGLLSEMDRVGDISVLRHFAREYRDQLPSGHEHDVALTIQMSWNLTSESEKRVLRTMCHLAPVSVPKRLLRNILGFAGESSPLADPLEEAIAQLKRLSLIELDQRGDPAAHRLILAYVKELPESAEFWNLAVDNLNREMARVADDHDRQSYSELEQITPHAEWIVRPLPVGASLIELSGNIGRHHRTHGRYLASKSFFEISLNLAQKNFELGHSEIAIRQSNLALVLMDLGELEEARDLLKQSLASAQKNFEPGNSNIADRQSNLALVLKDLGELEEARDLLREALTSDQKNFEPDHPSIASSQSNLAQVLQDLGEPTEARDLVRHALASAQKNFEPGHPSIAISQSNLALVLRDLGEVKEARDLLREALASDQMNFEPGHPSIAISQSNLALVLKDLGELEEARDLLKEALASDQKNFDPGHPSIAISQSNLALVLKDLGELEEARELLRDAHQKLLKRFGSNHPKTKKARRNLDGLSSSE